MVEVTAMSQTLGQGDVIEPFQKFKSAGKLAKTVAHWKIRGGQVAVSIFINREFDNISNFRQTLMGKLIMHG